MLKATEVLPAGHWDRDRAIDRIALDYDERHRRRFRFVAEGGTEFLLDLPRATVLQHGDGLALEGGDVITVIAASEALSQVTAADTEALMRLAWHIGNRHLPAQLVADRILIREDHVIVSMLRGLGATVEPVRAPFSPEGGAYSGHGGFVAAHEHAHGNVVVHGQPHEH